MSNLNKVCMLLKSCWSVSMPIKDIRVMVWCYVSFSIQTLHLKSSLLKKFHCRHCDLMTRRTRPVRPVQVSRGIEHGHTVSIDANHWKRNADGREAIIVNIIDEASKFHVALVQRKWRDRKPDSNGLHWNCPYELVSFCKKAPAVIRVDSENAFKSHESREWCAARRIEFPMAANDAKWQIGIVECHIRLLKNQLTISDARWASRCVDRRARWTLCGCQSETTDVWWIQSVTMMVWNSIHGRRENRSRFERRLEVQTAAQTAFVRAGARKTLHMAQACETTCTDKLNGWTVGEILRWEQKMGSVAVVIVVLVALVQQECWRLNSELKWNQKSQQLYGWPTEDLW